MLQVQLVVPSISADATVTATMKRDEEVELELESEIKVMDANSQQKINIKYGKLLFQLQCSKCYIVAFLYQGMKNDILLSVEISVTSS